ncbi:DUF262 domain-containing protein [Pseudonocardia sp. MH-G8]|uniref:DUF262 domain-containing protein n=1 Tax=Pseudonocardia sp. MH-G8 TaxID=1854588 RepID=UPI000BA085CE|nr:DUF262 domain-containing protein [Pseudonocardia sp. MH-G8]OZM79676.1 hypothetical protein CFP66_24205 [Pseudonocardia sp. MH-G8]
MVKKLEAHERQISKVLCSDYDLTVPAYQRPYAWEPEQAQELLDDLVLALDHSPEEPYFLGSIVLVKKDESPDCDIIDGQQRLTTLTILLAVLRELSLNKNIADGLDKRILEPGDDLQDIETKPRLALRPRDRVFFRKHVQEPGGLHALVAEPGPITTNDAQVALRANAKIYYDLLSGWTDNRRTALAKLVDKWTYLVVVTTPDLDSAHRIFSVMNDRGLDLRPTDNFKARVIGEIPEADRSYYNGKWEDAEQELGRDAFSSLFAHIRMIFAKQRAPRELLREFPEQVLDHYSKRSKEFVDDILEPYADAYAVLLGQSYKANTGAEAVNLWLKRLAQLDNVDWQPPALWALRKHGNDPQWLVRFLTDLERLAASLLIRRVGPTERQQRYGLLLRALEGGSGLRAQPLALSDLEQADMLRLLGGEIYQQARVRRYVLLRLDEELANAPGVSYDHKIITVEHVLPQNPSASSTWRRVFNDRQRAYWTHRIANLVLLNRTKNAQAQNYDFAVKKEKYFTGKKGVVAFALTSQVINLRDWTPELLEQRQRAAMQLLADTWNLNAGSDEHESSVEPLIAGRGTDGVATTPDDDQNARRQSFFDQLAERQKPEICAAVERVLVAWAEMGGYLHFGVGAETSCFLMAPNPLGHRSGIWPLTMYPSGRCEVVFQYLAVREPFDDPQLRDSLRRRLNSVTAVALPASKIEFRPSFPLNALGVDEQRDILIKQLAWFVDQIHLAAGCAPGQPRDVG